MNLLMIDTETGGRDSGDCALLQIAGVVFNEDFEIQSSMSQYVNPFINPKTEGLLMTREAFNVNGLSREKIELEGIDEAVALEEFELWLEGYYNVKARPHLVGWNLHFDISFLRAAYERHADEGLAWKFPNSTLDMQSLWTYANFFQFKQPPPGGITEAARIMLGKRVPHDALDDCLMQLELLKKFAED